LRGINGDAHVLINNHIVLLVFKNDQTSEKCALCFIINNNLLNAERNTNFLISKRNKHFLNILKLAEFK